MALFIALPMTAQDENSLKNVSVGELSYTIKEEPKTNLGTVVGAVLDVLAEQTTTEHITDALQVEPNADTNILLDGVVNYFSTTRELRTPYGKKDKIPQFYAQISLTLNLKDPATGTVINSQMFEVNRTGWSWYNSSDTAIKEALEGLRKKVEKYYNTAYPYTANILLERGVEKKDKQKELYIDLGAIHGLKEGTHFTVYILGSIGGKETRKQIGRLKVTSIEGDEVSLCKVSSGGKDIKAALDAQQRLLIISTD